MRSWREVKKDLLKDKKTALEYERLEPRYQLISQLIEARRRSGLSQKELAGKIGTKQSAIARVEAGNANMSFGFLERMVEALGSRLVVQIK